MYLLLDMLNLPLLASLGTSVTFLECLLSQHNSWEVSYVLVCNSSFILSIYCRQDCVLTSLLQQFLSRSPVNTTFLHPKVISQSSFYLTHQALTPMIMFLK